ncbi:MAG: hypothetical protein ABIT08_02170, partial [Bacteroidia bacterium]
VFHKIFIISTTLHTCSTRYLSSPRHLTRAPTRYLSSPRHFTRAPQDIYHLHDTSHVLHKKFIVLNLNELEND